MTFSILYEGPEGSDIYPTYAVDWDWEVKGKWATSEKSYCGCRWVTNAVLDEMAYLALLDAFGLSKNQVSLEKIITMSPKELFKIGIKNPESDTIGDHRKASEVE